MAQRAKLPGALRCARSPGDTRSHLLAEVLRWHDCAVFKVRARRVLLTGAPGLSKLNSMAADRFADLLRVFADAHTRATASRATQVRSTLGTGSSSRQTVCLPGLRRRSKSWSFPRKEVIQPHLPVRLPCYDFTPVTSPTFDGSLPKGLGHRLRVLLASVV